MRQTSLAMTCLCVALGALSGCGQMVDNYRAHGHEPDAARVVLVLPFLDTRSIDDVVKNPDDANAPEQVRRLFVEEFQKNAAISRKVVIAPMILRPERSITTDEAIAFGRQYGADLVIAGQLFFYLDERSIDIPARAGMFIRMFSVPEARQVFTGEHYAKGSAGGKAQQARVVSRAIIAHYTDKASAPSTKPAPADAPSVLVLPYLDVPNPDNIVETTGGGAIASSIYSMELELGGRVRVLAPGQENFTHKRVISAEEALAAARAANADYVLRGAVMEFRRAKDEPSVIWGAYGLVLQFVIAEMSCADIVSEVYRVSDGACIYAHRHSSRMKYRVITEVSVRDLARDVANGLYAAMNGKKTATPILEKALADAARRVPATASPASPDSAQPASRTVTAADTAPAPTASEATEASETAKAAAAADKSGADEKPVSGFRRFFRKHQQTTAPE